MRPPRPSSWSKTCAAHCSGRFPTPGWKWRGGRRGRGSGPDTLFGVSATRTERDSLGTVEGPADAYYGAQTERARVNFPISGYRMPRRFIEALGWIKAAAAAAHRESGALPREKADAIERAAREVARGERDADFVVDVFQTGSGTSTNMNANEVIANRAGELLGKPRGDQHVHPNDDVNRAQSSNDVIPAALHIAARLAIQ